MIEIRDMQPDDISSVIKIEKASFHEPWSEVHFFFELYSGTARNWVALKDGKVCAYLCFWKISDELHLNNIAVGEKWRGQGIAQIMLDRMTTYARKHRARLITLEVSEKNTAARAFYEKNDFRQVGMRKNYYEYDHADALILTKDMEKK